MVTRLLLTIVLHYAIQEIQGSTILSTGEHENSEFVWSEDVDNLQFNFSSVGKATVYHKWSHMLRNEEFINLSASYSLNYHNCTSESVNRTQDGISYKLTCNVDNGNLLTNFFIISNLNKTFDHSKVQVEYSGVSTIPNKTLHLKNCDTIPSSDTGKLKISGAENARFNEQCHYYCSDSTLVVDGVYNVTKDTTNYTRTCKFDAVWSGRDEVECWFAPLANITLNQNSSHVVGGQVIVDSNVTMNCTVYQDGGPKNISSTTFFIDNKGQNLSHFIPTPQNHGNAVSCQLQNKYVADVDNSSGISDPITLKVTFGPQKDDTQYQKNQFAEVGTEFIMRINFNANPRLRVSDTKLCIRNISMDQLNADIYGSDIVHNYTYRFSSVSKENFGEYVLIATSPSDNFRNLPVNFTVILNGTEPRSSTSPTDTTIHPNLTLSDSSDLSTGALVAIGVCGGVIVILIIVIIVWKLRQQNLKQDDSAREERDNPLYGTTPGPSYNTESASNENKKKKKKQDKEEKANPLYQSSGVGAETIEPAYGTVDQGYNTNPAGSDNSAYNPEMEVQYAAVNKPKKKKGADPLPEETLYSAVNKKKKKKADPPPEEAVYSAVNKKKKKQDSSADVGLHGAPATDV